MERFFAHLPQREVERIEPAIVTAIRPDGSTSNGVPFQPSDIFSGPGFCPKNQIFSGMARLTHSDLEAVLRVAQEVNRARTRDEFSRVALRELAELVRSDVLALNEVDPSVGRISYIAEPESFAPPRELEPISDGIGR